jgi:hypothetical protein
MTTTDTAATEQPPAALGPHPIFDALLAAEPEESAVREVFGLGHRDELAAPALEPDKVHDPRLVLRARVISSTPTGSLMLDVTRSRSVALHASAGGGQ